LLIPWQPGFCRSKKLLCGPTNLIDEDAVTNPDCSRRSDHGVDPCAWELAEIADLHPVVANECPKDVRIVGETVLSKRRHHTSGIE
jgi:hypothetical protein